MKRIQFYATKEDLVSFLDVVCTRFSLHCAQMGNFPCKEFSCSTYTLEDFVSLPNLGIANSDSAACCTAFLVSERHTPIQLRTVQAMDGQRVCIDQILNPDTVVFNPGGIWNSDILLYGSIGTSSESQISQTLMKQFLAAARKKFTKVKAYYIGPKAMTLLLGGKRLTISEQSPREFDLTLDSKNT